MKLITLLLLCLALIGQVSATYGKRIRGGKKKFKSIPLKGSGDTVFTIEPLTFDGDGNPITANVAVESLVRIRRLGKLKVDFLQFVNLVEGTIEGTSTWTARNGDQFFASYVGTSTPPDDGTLSYEATFTITGGNGRFDGAAGSFESGGTGNLAQGSGTVTVDGVLTRGIPLRGSSSSSEPTFVLEPLTLDENGNVLTANVQLETVIRLEGLGRVKLEAMQFGNLVEGTIVSNSTWTRMRNGDQFFATSIGTFTPTDASGTNLLLENTFTITGGTGRFKGASGSFQTTGTANLADGTGTTSVDGVLIPALPIKGSGTNTFTIEPLTFDGDNVVTANVHFEGWLHLKQLGEVELEAAQFVNIPAGTLEGNSNWTTRNGDQFFATYVGTSTPPDMTGLLSYDATFTITGGTGRFKGASGSFEGGGSSNIADGRGTVDVDGFLTV